MTQPSGRMPIVYTTPTCPDCHALKAWLKARGIAFEERDLSDPAIMAEAKARTGLRVAPITVIGNLVFFGSFEAQRKGLTAALDPAGTDPVEQPQGLAA